MLPIFQEYMTKEINKEKFMARNPDQIGIVGGVVFYEHPAYGDESPLIAIYEEKAYLTTQYELDDFISTLNYELATA
jgi:hypothetical protein